MKLTVERVIPEERPVVESETVLTCPDCLVELVALLKLVGEPTEPDIFYQVMCPRCKIWSYKRRGPLKISIQALPPFCLAGLDDSDDIMKLSLVEKKMWMN
jgi:hypothetical protein